MVNLMQYREVADYGEEGGPSISGREADDLYTPMGPLAEVGAEVVFAAEVETQLLGAGVPWDRIGVVKYPTRKAFIDMQAIPAFQDLHKHKDAGMERTIIIGCQPIDLPVAAPGGTEPDWTAVPHPQTDDDPYVVVMHVLSFHDAPDVATHGLEGTDEDHMAAYQRAASGAATRHGARLDGWFRAEGTIIGDGRRWDQVRFNAFPSREAFMAVVADPERLAGQKEHRETAIADTYTMILRPLVNRLREA
jgi:uncharacterized protein (DUF1330 family)